MIRMFLDRVRLAVPATLLALAALTSTPAQAEWVGGGVVHSPAGTCQNQGWPVQAEMVRARVRNARDEGDRYSVVTLSFIVGGLNTYSFRGNLYPATTFRTARGTSVWDQAYSLNFARPRIQVVRWDSHDNEGGNGTVTRLGEFVIRNFNGQVGCTVTATLALRDNG